MKKTLKLCSAVGLSATLLALLAWVAIPREGFTLEIKMKPNLISVFSDDPYQLHDPRYRQGQTGAGKPFGPIGLVITRHPIPHVIGGMTTLVRDMGTGFLVSPCYILTAYHVVFGNERHLPDPDRDYAVTFRAGDIEQEARPIKYGAFFRSENQDWALLRLAPASDAPCLGTEIGWLQLVSLSVKDASERSLSTAGYPSDKSAVSLWRQDHCHLIARLSSESEGIWSTTCSTMPRASGSPIFFLKAHALAVVAMMHGHVGREGEVALRHWDPGQPNLAIDAGDILRGDPTLRGLISTDIRSVKGSNPAERLSHTAKDRRH